ncbi:MSC_0623 family F1-like ATPase-associated protein [Mycoplasma procyoni]|uniref:MSC_0623 family F1-like ATPase-associated protein n=1 Tax=Mycoplasma procyoni TaxID=568784 RepID=UPI00197CB039|nr:DUF2714 domain-containing protein [Mycoplasma procyoni]MBN3534777.1 DUF2714 domain-containing protein [Mycoplasma procyoni]
MSVINNKWKENKIKRSIKSNDATFFAQKNYNELFAQNNFATLEQIFNNTEICFDLQKEEDKNVFEKIKNRVFEALKNNQEIAFEHFILSWKIDKKIIYPILSSQTMQQNQLISLWKQDWNEEQLEDRILIILAQLIDETFDNISNILVSPGILISRDSSKNHKIFFDKQAVCLNETK